MLIPAFELLPVGSVSGFTAMVFKDDRCVAPGSLPTCVLWKDLGGVCGCAQEFLCVCVWSGRKDITSSLFKYGNV